jgi:hypothetical protein
MCHAWMEGWPLFQFSLVAKTFINHETFYTPK